MRTIELETCPQFAFVGFYGSESSDYDLVWDENGHGIADAAVAVGTRYIMPEGTYSVILHILSGDDVAEVRGEVFWESTILVDEKGLEVTEVVEASETGAEGNLGTYFELGWRGRCRLRFVAPDGFEDDGEGKAVPKSLKVFVSPAHTTEEYVFHQQQSAPSKQ